MAFAPIALCFVNTFAVASSAAAPVAGTVRVKPPLANVPPPENVPLCVASVLSPSVVRTVAASASSQNVRAKAERSASAAAPEPVK
jgi:hypothetical protein